MQGLTGKQMGQPQVVAPPGEGEMAARLGQQLISGSS